MPTLLHIDSSPRTHSVSSALAAQFVERWRAANPGATVIHHNTSTEKLPYLDEAAINAFFTPVESHTEEQKKIFSLSDKLVDELIAADLIVLGSPMWNFGIPASLKAWIDLIVRVGRTFKYTPEGAASLLPANKRAYVFTARGGAYPKGTPFEAYDLQEPYLRAVLGFLGVQQVEFVHADNQARSGDAPQKGLAAAEEKLAALAI
jgi:FMN-dependent NADH-azoreductase